MQNKWEERKISLGGAIIAAAVTMCIGIFIGLNWTTFASNFLPYFGITPRTTSDWSALDEVYSELAYNYDGDLDKTALIEGAKQGMVTAVGDVYTEYMPAQEAKEYQAVLHGDAGEGIGVEMALRDGYVRVLRTLPDNPAEKAGILAGDILYKVNGEEVYTLSTDEISNKIRGQGGTGVEVTVVRDGKELTFKMIRETINNVSAYVTYDGHTAIITVTRFDNDTGTMVQNFVKSNEFKSHNINKVILDLRNNGGGYVSAAKDLLSLWLDGEPILIQKSKNRSDDTMYANRSQALLKDTKTIVLVNGSTASASEIVAGALKDYSKATIVGETTYGKGVVQTLFDLSGSSLLKVTTARWYTPKGNSINGEGITPDITVERTYDDINHDRDPQLTKAKEL